MQLLQAQANPVTASIDRFDVVGIDFEDAADTGFEGRGIRAAGIGNGVNLATLVTAQLYNG